MRASRVFLAGVGAAVLVVACTTAPREADLGELRAPPPGTRSVGVFEGKVPCFDCERTKVRIGLYQRSDAKAPTNYLLERVYVGKGNDRLVTEGSTTTDIKGHATILRFDDAAPPEFRQYQRVGDDLLLILAEDGRPRIGNAQHSFTLSRTQ